MSLVGSQIHTRQIRTLSQAGPDAKQKLGMVFSAFDEAFPEDGVAASHLRMLGQTPRMLPPLAAQPDTLVGASRTVLRAIVEAAEANGQGLGESAKTPARRARLTGDALAGFYVRRAADAAQTLPPELAPRAFLLGLAVGLDDSRLLRNSPLVGSFCRDVESESARKYRLQVLGATTMRARRDLAQHFAVSCGLTVLVGSGATESVGIAKELWDTRTGGEFSFADLSADLAGILFAEHVRDRRVELSRLAESFAVEDFLPGCDDLAEDVSWKEFVRTYGSTQDERFTREATRIRERILTLPGYRARADRAEHATGN